jgi:hypothetical protein
MKKLLHLVLVSLLFSASGCGEGVEPFSDDALEAVEAPLGIQSTCTYSIKRTGVKAVYRENSLDKTLELLVEVTASTAPATNTVSWDGDLREGSSDTSSASVLSNTVPVGTVVNYTLDIHVTEFDSGLNGPDYGDWENQSFSFTCQGTGTTTHSPTITADDGSKTQVKVVVQYL